MTTGKLTAALWRNDLFPSLTLLATYGDGTVVDLSAATAPRFLMRLAGDTELKVDATATITDGAAGEITYAWAEGDTDTAGRYEAQFQVELDGKPLTLPAPAQALEVVIRQDLG